MFLKVLLKLVSKSGWSGIGFFFKIITYAKYNTKMCKFGDSFSCLNFCGLKIAGGNRIKYMRAILKIQLNVAKFSIIKMIDRCVLYIFLMKTITIKSPQS